jgi:hypothetical protein
MLIKFCGLEARVKSVRIGALFTERLSCSCSQVFGIVGNEVGQVAPFGMVPELFDRIEFWGIGGQPFDLQPRGLLLLQQADCFAMYTPAIQYDDQRPPQLSMQHAEETDDLFGRNVVIVEVEVTAQTQCPGSHAQGAHDAPAVVSVPSILHGRVSTRRPSPPPQRLQHQARFVEKDQASFSFEPLFLVAARSRCASEQSPLRPVPALAAWASARSSPACATVYPHSPRGTRHRKGGGSLLRLAHRSTNQWQTPSDVDRGPTPSKDAAAVFPIIEADDPAPAWQPRPACPSRPPRLANDLPTTHWLLPGGPLRLASCPVGVTQPPAVAEPPTVGPFHEISSQHDNKIPGNIPLLS